ncbi:bestrophin family protein [Thioclava sp. GXIMD4215]|uniref:bestrophin family protein n=1 Tax=Thioclava sp. GXIMD4215 TaxID=3131928 RepID=UPI00325095DD
MIIRKRPTILGLFFILQGSVVQIIWPQILVVFGIGIAVVLGHDHFPDYIKGLDPSPFALIGIALSIFLSFRNGACYDRWWEARKHWGVLIQSSRDVIRQTTMLEDLPERSALLHSLIRFAHLVETQLRGHSQNWQSDEALAQAARIVGQAEREGKLTHVEALVLHESLTRLSQSLLACERLANTPVPFAYSLLLHRTAYIYCVILPFGFVDTLGAVAPLVAGLVAYAFFGLDALAEELEQPFSDRVNALPLTAFATAIEISLKRALGETDLPQMPEAVDFILR